MINCCAAGPDTSTTAINTTLFYAANHPRVLRKLELDLFKCFPKLGDIHPNTAENCKYLKACLDDAMRLCPWCHPASRAWSIRVVSGS